jgi:serine/threonine protein kinase
MDITFHGIPPDLQAVMLMARKGVGPYLGSTSGFVGKILKFQAGTSDQCCAKIPHAEKLDPKTVAVRFLREMRIQREMFFHEFVHWPFEFNVILDTFVAWFRYWDGDLADLIEDSDFTIEGRLAMLAYIAAALRHCHSRGLVAHQDLKPENIFFRDLESSFSDLPDLAVWRIPKLADFGSANLASEVGEFRGTRPYMAPEQWSKTPLGTYTSVWSIGVIGYELLTFGRHPIGEMTKPWRQGDKSVFKKWQDDRPWRRWVKAGCQLTDTLADAETNNLITACLSVDPTKRPKLNDVISSLMRILQRLSPEDATQARFRIDYADRSSAGDHDWPYLDAQYNSAVETIAQVFGDPSILDLFRLETGAR